MDIVSTPSAENANSYLSVAEAGEYFATRFGSDAWDEASTADREKSLVTACRAIESCRLLSHRRPYGWPGEPVDATSVRYDPVRVVEPTQSLAFPRFCDLDADGEYVVPQAVQFAQCEEALSLLKRGAESERRADLQADGVTHFAVDGLTESYGAPKATYDLLGSARARALLQPYMDRSGVIATSHSPDGEFTPASSR